MKFHWLRKRAPSFQQALLALTIICSTAACGLRVATREPSVTQRPHDREELDLLRNGISLDSAMRILASSHYLCVVVNDAQSFSCQTRLPRRFWLVPQSRRVSFQTVNGRIAQLTSWTHSDVPWDRVR